MADETHKIKIEIEPEDDWLADDLPPNNPNRPNGLSAFLVSLLLNEVSATVQDVNKILYVLGEIERNTVARQPANGETPPSPLVDNFIQMLKNSKIDANVRAKLEQLQASRFKFELERALQQSWQALRLRTNNLKKRVKQQETVVTFKPEEYSGEGENQPIPTPAPEYSIEISEEVAPAVTPLRELVLDVFDEPEIGEIVLVAEHSGLLAGTIRVNLNHDILNLTATDLNQTKYSKECLLPSPVQAQGFTQTYHNGILQIRFKKLD